MPRRPPITPNEYLNIRLSANIKARLELLLWSEVDGRVPYGAFSRLITDLLTEYFEAKPLDIGPFIGAPKGQHIIKGSASTLSALLTHLQEVEALKEGET